MARPENGEGMRIGDVLKRARTRQGLEISAVEERTKIRTKYLRALEAEEWDVLPSPAYARGFLRTYAQLLGLDADAIIDEYRRQVETALEPGQSYGVGEPVLEGRRRLGDRGPNGPRVGLLLAIGAVAVVAILLVIGLVGGDDGDDGDKPRSQASAKQQKQKQERRQQRQRQQRREEQGQQQQEGNVALRLTISSDVQVCLLAGDDEVLIDGQVLSAGTEEQFERERFELRFPSGYDRGQFDLSLDGKATRLPELSGPAAFAIEAGSKPRQLDPPGLECP